MDSQQVYVIGMQKVDFTNGNGEKIMGTRIFYSESKNDDLSSVRGYVPLKAWFNGFEKFEELKNTQIPGFFNMKYKLGLSGSSAKVIITDFEQIREGRTSN